MKTFCFFWLMASAVIAAGQSSSGAAWKPTSMTVTKAYCPKTLSMGGSTRTFKDIFPEECGGGLGGSITGTFGTLPIGVGYTCGESSYDAPAVMEPSREAPNGPACTMYPCGHKFTQWCNPAPAGPDGLFEEFCQNKPFLAETCADKSRILQHDEDNPPKYWCHKPQP